MSTSPGTLDLRPLWEGGPAVTFLGYGAMELRGGADVHRRPRPLARDVAHAEGSPDDH